MKKFRSVNILILLLLLISVTGAGQVYAASSPTTFNPIETGIVTVTPALNVREAPNTTCKILGSLNDNQPVAIYSDDGTWLKIFYNGTWAYIYKEFVKNITPVSPQKNTTNPSNDSLIQYTHPINVYIDRATNSIIDLTINTGTYDLYDRDTQEVLPFSNSIQFVNEGSDVLALFDNGIIVKSNSGFQVRELSGSSNGSFTVNKTVGGVVSIDPSSLSSSSGSTGSTSTSDTSGSSSNTSTSSSSGSSSTSATSSSSGSTSTSTTSGSSGSLSGSDTSGPSSSTSTTGTSGTSSSTSTTGTSGTSSSTSTTGTSGTSSPSTTSSNTGTSNTQSSSSPASSSSNTSTSGTSGTSSSSTSSSVSGTYSTFLTSNSYDYKYYGSLTIKPGTNKLSLMNTVGMNHYLKGVVPSEMPSSWPLEALKSQAVAARNYAYTRMLTGSVLYDDQRSQVYHGINAQVPSTDKAVDDTKGIIATYNGRPIQAYFNSSSGGYTANSEDVWVAKLPYIRAVKDPYSINSANPYNSWTTTISNDTMVGKLNLTNSHILSLKITQKDVSGRANQINVTSYNTQTNQTNTTTLPGSSSTPDSLRSAFGTSLRSTLFNITPEDVSVKVKMADGSTQSMDHLMGAQIALADGTTQPINGVNLGIQDTSNMVYQKTFPLSFNFNGKGNGHGLGLSQYGAYEMAREGNTYDKILKFYYTGISLEPMK